VIFAVLVALAMDELAQFLDLLAADARVPLRLGARMRGLEMRVEH